MLRRGLFAALASIAACASPAAPAEEAHPPATSYEAAQRQTSQRDMASELEEIEACGYEGCRGPFHAASELDFGAFPMGTAVPDIPSNAICGRERLQDRGPARICGFTLDGVIYVTIDGVVVGKDIDVGGPPSSGLPFGLQAGQTLEAALAAVRQHTAAPLSVKMFPVGGMRYISNDDVLKNGQDRPFLFSLIFVNGGLVRIMLQDPSAPSD